MLASKLKPFIDRYDEISNLLIQTEILSDIKRMTELSKEQSDLEKLVQKSKQYLKNLESIEENKGLLDDKELGDLAKEEIKEAELENQNLESEIKILLLPKDPNDEKIFIWNCVQEREEMRRESLLEICLKLIFAMPNQRVGK